MWWSAPPRCTTTGGAGYGSALHDRSAESLQAFVAANVDSGGRFPRRDICRGQLLGIAPSQVSISAKNGRDDADAEGIFATSSASY